MPIVSKKQPFSPFVSEQIQSKNIADFIREVRMRLTTTYMGQGLAMMVQFNNEDDPLNLVYENRAYHGTVYFLRVTKEKIIDLRDDDLEMIAHMILVMKDEV